MRPLFALRLGIPTGTMGSRIQFHQSPKQGSNRVGTKKTGKGRRKLGRKKRRMRAKIRHRKK